MIYLTTNNGSWPYALADLLLNAVATEPSEPDSGERMHESTKYRRTI